MASLRGIKRWPNGLGYSKPTPHGEIYIVPVGEDYHVTIPLPDRREWVEHPLHGPARYRTVCRVKRLVVNGGSIAEAIDACRERGAIEEV